MMGATLPAMSRWVETSPRGIAWLGFFYGGNIGGAVCGSLLAGFYLLRVYDMAIATYVAVFLNLTVAGIGLLMSRMTRHEPSVSSAAVIKAPGSGMVYFVIAFLVSPRWPHRCCGRACCHSRSAPRRIPSR
jgi:spermidine synthase